MPTAWAGSPATVWSIFYDEISREELYEICTVKVAADLEKSLESMLAWLNQNPDRMD